MPRITYAQAINDGYVQAMALDKSVIAYGLGIDDPKGIFGTTLGLKEKFGAERVFDMPVSENAMTGIAIGAALNGIRPVMCHQRMDFFLLGMDQLVNNAAKWSYMFGGQSSVPVTIRAIIGRGWGQGPTHSQSLQAWLAHVPGIKVVMPATAADAKGLLISSIFDDNPVVYLEHRWLHNLEGEVPAGDYRIPIGKAKILNKGSDVTIVAYSYMVIEALHAVNVLNREGISCELIDLRSVSPLDWEAIFSSVKKTGRFIALDTASETGSISSDVVARASMECFSDLKCKPERIALPDFPSPTSFALTKAFYRGAEDIIKKAAGMLGKKIETDSLVSKRKYPHDVPGDWFKGPF